MKSNKYNGKKNSGTTNRKPTTPAPSEDEDEDEDDSSEIVVVPAPPEDEDEDDSSEIIIVPTPHKPAPGKKSIYFRSEHKNRNSV